MMRIAPVLCFLCCLCSSPLLLAPAAAVEADSPEQGLDTPEQRLGYLYGYSIAGSSIKQFSQRYGLDEDALLQGLRDALAEVDSRVPPSEQERLFQRLEEERLQRDQAAATANADAGAAYLAEQSERAGVVALPDGVLYEVLVAGEGPTPEATDTVRVHYRGSLIDGQEFDSSYSRNAPATFPLNGVIAGWSSALQEMPVGSKWRLYIPPEMGYGENAPPSIGPNQVLVFEVELLDILPGGAQ